MTAAVGALPVARGAAETRRKAPFPILYSNDTTNIHAVISPYHKRGEPVTGAMIEGSVDEAAGVDAHMIQPGYCWVSWWKSKSFPTQEHYRWLKETRGIRPDPIGEYLLKGGDLLGVFLLRCREKRQAPFISFRVNDGHYLDEVGTTLRRAVYVSRFYTEHPEYRLGKGASKWEQRVHNWAIPEVREHKFQFLREICEGYDIDGLELDFQRFPSYFRQGELGLDKRAIVMTDFVVRVRKLLDATARPGQHRWLCARVPSYLGRYKILGLDLPASAEDQTTGS